ncbi:MAG: membrane protein insertase YidC [Rhodobacteraceae bacterium]|nr:membrane protein insertase YidC [Paracoccaceae bacterium]
MDDQNKNLILATALSFLVILGWFILFPPPEPDPEQLSEMTAEELVPPGAAATGGTTTVTSGAIESVPGAAPAPQEQAVDTPRIAIDTPRLEGSISLQGGRLDDLRLKDYHVTIDPKSPIVTMLRPVSEIDAYYTLHGWAPASGLAPEDVPGPNTIWTQRGDNVLGTDSPIILDWDNGNGLTFSREIDVDENYMFTITQTVTNNGDTTVAMAPYGIIARHGEPKNLKNFFILHEGIIAMADGTLTETDYSDMPDMPDDRVQGVKSEIQQIEANGWIGFTDHYWMTTLIPEPGTRFRAVSRYDETRDIYQAETVQGTQTLAPGEAVTVTSRLFAGAKEWEAIRNYERQDGIEGFLDSIDWGWFFFLTKPIFWLLHELNILIGNMGWAIIALTLILKAVLLPLAYKSYVSMAKMKELQPQMEKLKEAAGDDRQKLQQGMMELYKKEKVNPAAGCLPILLQIPIFFSLYKVIFVTIELRHAPWFGPFRDLSAPDPTSIMNLFGLLPWAGPAPESFLALIMIGILPLLLGISMWLQQKLNPAPTDPTQQMIFAWMPWVFMFMLGGFASGLVIYWIANNVITFVQQFMIMRSQGYTPDVFGNIKSSFKRGEKTEEK